MPPVVTGSVAHADLAGALRRRLPGRVEAPASSADLTTYRIGGPIAVLARVARIVDLELVAEVIREIDPAVLIVGRGSNLLVAERGFDGLGVILEGEFEALVVGDWSVHAGGAVPLPLLARRSASAGRSGLEFFVGIPGGVGGAVRMNAGGHGQETRAVLRRAQIFDLDAGSSDDRDVEDLGLGYRTSDLQPRDVVVEAEFGVEPDHPSACEARVADVVRWRREHQPGGSNAGSVFRNPPDDSAGRLIDECGLKGLRVGGAQVSPKHANFFQAEAGARADDVFALVVEVRRRVEEQTGVELVPELRFVGFSDVGTEP